MTVVRRSRAEQTLFRRRRVCILQAHPRSKSRHGPWADRDRKRSLRSKTEALGVGGTRARRGEKLVASVEKDRMGEAKRAPCMSWLECGTKNRMQAAQWVGDQAQWQSPRTNASGGQILGQRAIERTVVVMLCLACGVDGELLHRCRYLCFPRIGLACCNAGPG